MNFKEASKHQLIQIALHENCDLTDKYSAVRQLQSRRKADRRDQKNRDATWDSLFPLISKDFERLEVKIKQVFSEITSFNVTAEDARKFILSKLLDLRDPYTPKEESRLLDLYKRGMKIYRIAEEIGRTDNSVRVKLTALRLSGKLTIRRFREKRGEKVNGC